MQKENGRYIYSPTDLVKFLDDPFVSWMDRFECDRPGVHHRDPPEQSLWADEGFRHEAETLAKLEAKHGPATDLKGSDDPDGRRTRRAIEDGHPLIFQGALVRPPFRGYSDFLVRIAGASRLGDFHYEVWDTKLARSAKAAYAIQLCCYSEMLAAIQDRLPEHFTVFLGNGEEARFRTEDYLYYYLNAKRAFLAAQAAFDPNVMPVPTTDDCGRWSTFAARRLEELDHLSRVANLSKVHVQAYEAVGLGTMRALGATPPPARPTDVDEVIFEKHTRQARLQLASVGRPRPAFEVLPHATDGCVGLAALPPADEGDVYFDLEGYPLIVGGLEYLWGVVYRDAKTAVFRDWWAHDAVEERRAFENFMDWLHARWTEHPNLHVYHYAPYETAVLKRLADRYGTRQRELDDMLRGLLFVDLYAVVRNGICVGAPNYSIKSVEKIYGQARTGLVGRAGDSIVEYHRWRQTPAADAGRPAILKGIRDYNEDDCRSTLALAEWLRDLQTKSGIAYRAPYTARATQKPPSEQEERAERVERALRDVVAPAGPTDERQRIVQTVADLLGFYRRELKPKYWEFFDRLQNRTADDLVFDLECLAQLVRSGAPPTGKKRAHVEFVFDPRQETKLDVGKKAVFHHDSNFEVQIEALDWMAGRVTLSFMVKDRERIDALPSPLAILPKVSDYSGTLETALCDTAERLARGLPSRLDLPKALGDFLSRRPPDTAVRTAGEALIRDGARLVDDVMAIALGLRSSALCLQGPPGTGKTYTASHVILALLRAGKRVGVTSNSHKAIDHLLRQVRGIARAAGFDFDGATIGDDQEATAEELDFRWYDTSSAYYGEDPAQLVGGTAWTFANGSAVDHFDYLFVEEAGQFALAHLVASARATKNLILLGDPMQLEQPTQGTHPGEGGASCLQYFMKGRATMPPDLGVFLPVTRRLHPSVCHFVSNAIYEGRLHPHPDNATRVIEWDDRGPHRLKSAGIQFVGVTHEGNSNSSDEEVAVIREIVEHALRHGRVRDGTALRPVTIADILFIAPYNIQRAKLQVAFPDARVGTVDLFQGQEAPIVILSMCSSSSELSSRGLEFLFSRNRINVAVSRAQSLAIVVGHPGLTASRAGSLEKMALVNLYCRLVAEGAPEKND